MLDPKGLYIFLLNADPFTMVDTSGIQTSIPWNETLITLPNAILDQIIKVANPDDLELCFELQAVT